MLKGKQFINRLSSFQKLTCLIFLIVITLFFSLVAPTLSRYKNRNSLVKVSVWDGSVATGYRKGNGSIKRPYVISDGSELAYFQTQLLETDYENTYFELSHDILINDGVFKYDTDNSVQFIKDDNMYYVSDTDNNYYDNIERTGEQVGSLNVIKSLDGFKGSFNGNSHTIYGLYMYSNEDDEVSLFTNLEGHIHDLYVDNSIMKGGVYTAGIASRAKGAIIKNVLFNGTVIGKNDLLTNNLVLNPKVEPIALKKGVTISYIDLELDMPMVGNKNVVSSISGNYTIDVNTSFNGTITINGEPIHDGSFHVDLNDNMFDKIPVFIYSDHSEEVNFTFSDLVYNISYEYGVSGGVIGYADNVTLENVVNKGSVYNTVISGGLIGGSMNYLNINQSYNTGDIYGDYISAGIAGTIENKDKEVYIANSYNVGDALGANAGGLISTISNSFENINLNNVFDASLTNYAVNTIGNATVEVSKAYFVNGESAIYSGYVNGDFDLINNEELENKNFMINNMSFNEYVDYNDIKNNYSNAWVYEDASLPILFLDDIKNPIATIHVGRYSWNNFSLEIDKFRFESNITFSVNDANEFKPPKEIYYYISNSKDPLTKEQLNQVTSWVLYEDIVQIKDEGLYVVYAKVVDYEDKVTYINTDLLVLDTPGLNGIISTKNHLWNSYKNELEHIFVDRSMSFDVLFDDGVSEVANIRYYISDQILTVSELNKLKNHEWIELEDKILVNKPGKNIVYVQIIDDFDYITYINTDVIVLDGYIVNELTVGRNEIVDNDTDIYITDKSLISLNYTYELDFGEEMNNHNHNLISNILLPKGTKITILDNVKSAVYNYVIPTNDDYYNYHNSCNEEEIDCTKVATYPFTLFKEVGAIDKYFIEDSYYDNGEFLENFTIIIDFFKADITRDYDETIFYLELHNEDGNSVRPTIFNTLKKVNIKTGSSYGANLYLSTDYTEEPIFYNTDSTTAININSALNYQMSNGNKVMDTTFDDNEIGIAIKLVDENLNVLDKEYLKNIIFKIEENQFYPENDNIIRINLNNGIDDYLNKLTIITRESNNTLEPGTYYFKISNFAALDGHYYNEIGSDEITIPVIVSEDHFKIPYAFDVVNDKLKPIINKTEDNVSIMFNILQNGDFKNPNIRVSLYKKEILSAHDQKYVIVDLADYASNNLVEVISNSYYVSKNPLKYTEKDKLYNEFSLDLITDKFENNGYKFVFELYDDNKKIGIIEKYFIVK